MGRGPARGAGLANIVPAAILVDGFPVPGCSRKTHHIHNANCCPASASLERDREELLNVALTRATGTQLTG